MPKQLYPEGSYKIVNVGPSSPWEFNGNKLIKYTIQLENVAEWVELNQAEKTAEPTRGQTIEGRIEQDDAGKYAPRFKKANKGGGGFGGGGGGNASPGAIWSAAYATAVAAVNGYLSIASDTKRKKAGSNIEEYFALIDIVAEKLKDRVDAHAATPTASNETPKTESESGESPVKSGGAEVVDISEDDINDEEW